MGAESRSMKWTHRLAVVNLVLALLWLTGALYVFIAGHGFSPLVADSAVDVVRIAVMLALMFGPPAVVVSSSVFLLHRRSSAGDVTR